MSGRLPVGGAIDRAVSLAFSFDGKRYQGQGGDTLASALMAAGVRVVGRSFKYHRARGIYSAGPEEPNALVTLERGSASEPNTPATTVELFEGLVARSQNSWPSLRFDFGSIANALSGFIPAGFYYKTFMWPGSAWMFYEHFIRRAAGMGRLERTPDESRYEQRHVFCDVLVVGGGPAGIAAALAAGRTGARVMLYESGPLLGGALWRDDETIDGEPAHSWLSHAVAELRSLPNAQVVLRGTVFGYYDNNVLGAVERVTDHLASPDRRQPRQRLHIIRARRVILAAGAIERPLVFENNDLPGVMLAGAARTYVKRFAVAPGRRVVVFTNNDDAYRTALTLHTAGIEIAAVIDSRAVTPGALPAEVRRRGIECAVGHTVLRAAGRHGVEKVRFVGWDSSRGQVSGSERWIRCDSLAVSGGWSPTVHLHSQSGGKLAFDAGRAAFLPGTGRQAAVSVGASAGINTLSGCLESGMSAGEDAAAATGFTRRSTPTPWRALGPDSTAITALWVAPGAKRKAFVDIQTDVTLADVALAQREGYISIEHLKRYTTLGMGTDQGKTSNLNGLAIMASLQNTPIAQTGTTTFRPPYLPVALGVFAGRELGQHYFPVRRTPLHDWHIAQGAQMIEVGLWMRPQSYLRNGESAQQAYLREASNVRKAVGLIDVSTLGKIEIHGPDALELLDRVYANNWHSLATGRVRYGLMLREDGIVLDDGTTARLGDHHYFMTTTTANAGRVLAHIEFLSQVVWPHLRVQVTSVTDEWGTMALAGPESRSVLSRVVEGGMAVVDDRALPHLGVLLARVNAVPSRIFRMSYSGELAYEIAVPADRAPQVWEAVLDAGRAEGIQVYGADAMGALRIEKGHIAGPELDGRTTADDLGLGHLLSTRKDFIGRQLLQRPELRNLQRHQLVGLVPNNRAQRLRAGAQIIATPVATDATPMIGHVSSTTASPTLGHDIALALIQGGRTRIGQTVYAAFPLRDEVIEACVVEPVFYDKEGKRFRG